MGSQSPGTTRVTDEWIVRTMPYPVASSWRALSYATNDDERITRLRNTLEVTLRTLVALLVPDYLRGPPVERVEDLFRQLEGPSNGHYLGLIRECLRAIQERSSEEVPPFIPEACGWFWHRSSRKLEETDAAKRLSRAVEFRNDIEHRLAPANGAARIREYRLEFESILRELLGSLDWLSRYRLLRVASQRPLRRGIFEASVGFFVGHDSDRPPLENLRLGVYLPDDPKGVVFLSKPDGSAFLEVYPFLLYGCGEQPRRDGQPESTNDTCLLFKKTVGRGKRLQLVNDNLGIRRTVCVNINDSEIPFDQWLKARDPTGFVHENKFADEVASRLEGTATRQIAEPPLHDRFDELREVGKGSMATVYCAHDKIWDRTVALKVIDLELSKDADFVKRFEREADLAFDLRSDHLVRAYTRGKLDDGRLWYAMDYIEGRTLRDVVSTEEIPEERVRVWAGQLLGALKAVHERNVVHRDIKPANCLLNEKGDVLLTDFGVARVQNSELTRAADRLLGNQRYAAPEQLRGQAVAASDVYALASMLHELLVGALPRRPGEGVEGPLGELLRSMGSDDPAQRPTAAEALDQLRRLPPPRSAHNNPPLSSSSGSPQGAEDNSSHTLDTSPQAPDPCLLRTTYTPGPVPSPRAPDWVDTAGGVVPSPLAPPRQKSPTESEAVEVEVFVAVDSPIPSACDQASTDPPGTRPVPSCQSSCVPTASVETATVRAPKPSVEHRRANVAAEVLRIPVSLEPGPYEGHAAVKANDVERLRQLAERPISFFEKDDNGQVPAHIAARLGHVNCLQIIAEVAPDSLAVRDGEDRSPSDYAATADAVDCIEYLASHHGHLLTLPDANGMTAHERWRIRKLTSPLSGKAMLVGIGHRAVTDGSLELLQAIAEESPDAFREVNEHGQVPAHVAVHKNAADCLEVIARAAFDSLNIPDNDGHTAADYVRLRHPDLEAVINKYRLLQGLDSVEPNGEPSATTAARTSLVSESDSGTRELVGVVVLRKNWLLLVALLALACVGLATAILGGTRNSSIRAQDDRQARVGSKELCEWLRSKSRPCPDGAAGPARGVASKDAEAYCLSRGARLPKFGEVEPADNFELVTEITEDAGACPGEPRSEFAIVKWNSSRGELDCVSYNEHSTNPSVLFRCLPMDAKTP